MKKVTIIGAGLSGLTIARILTDNDFEVEVFEQKEEIGGAIIDKIIDNKLVHIYGPHIFHTSNEEVWNFINKYEKFKLFNYYAKVNVDNIEYDFPINAKSVEKISNHLKLDTKAILKKLSTYDRIITLKQLFELNNDLGKWIWENNFVNYSSKMWDLPIDKIDNSIIERIKMLSTNEKNYFPLEKNVAIPTIGYFNFIKNLAKDIKINTNVNINNKVLELSNNNIVVFTGSVDELFNYKFGQLQYRSLKFDIVKEDWSFDVGCVNLPQHPNYTRKSNFNYFYNFQQTNEYVCYETPCYYNGTNLRLYPISSNTSNAEIYTKYKSELGKYQNIFLAGRAGTYKYLDMDKIIAQAFEIANEIINKYKM